MTAPTAPPFNTNNVTTGAAALYIAPKNTPMPSDAAILFDPTLWTGKTLTAGGATSITLAVANSQGTQTGAALATFGSVTAAQVQSNLAALSNVGAGNVIVTGATPGGPFVITFANQLGPVTLTISASTGGTPTITGGLWTPPGATEAGWTFGTNKTTNDINVEEQSTPVGRYIQSQSVSIAGTILEASRANWQLALNATKALIAAASGVPGMTVLTLTDDLAHYAVCLESKNEYGFATRDYIPDTVQAAALSVAHRRAAGPKGLAVEFSSVCPTNQIVSRAVTAAALP